MTSSVVMTNDAHVAIARLSGVKGNALTTDLVHELDRALSEAERDNSISCFVLISDGSNFCTGADLQLLRAVSADPLADEAYDGLSDIYELFCHVQDSPLVTVAGIGGKVLGAGINLALCCDVRAVADDVAIRGFGVAAVHPGGGHLRMLDRNLGPQRSAALSLLGEAMDADGAVASGFALNSVPRASLEQEVLRLAHQAGDDPTLTRRIVASYRAGRTGEMTPRAAVMAERAAQLWSLRRRFRDGA